MNKPCTYFALSKICKKNNKIKACNRIKISEEENRVNTSAWFCNKKKDNNK